MNFSRQHQIGFLIVAGILVSVAIYLLIQFNFSPSAYEVDRQATLSEDIVDIEGNVSSSSDPETYTGSTNEPPVSMVDVIRVCPDNATISRDSRATGSTASVTEECWETLETHFSHKEYVGHRNSEWIKFPNAMTHRRVFEDPKRDRDAVLAAIEQPECQFDIDPKVRSELKNTCQADSLTAFAAFTAACGIKRNYLHNYDFTYESAFRGGLYLDKGQRYPNWKGSGVEAQIARMKNIHLSFATNKQGIINNKQYDRFAINDSESLLYSLWMKKKCAQFDIDTLLISSDGLDQTLYDRIVNIGEVLGVAEDELSDPPRRREIAENLSRVMYSMAAHYGDFTASLSEVAFDPLASAGLKTYLSQQHPWVENASFIVDESDFGREIVYSSEPLQDLVKLLTRSMNGLVQLDDHNYEYDLPWLVNQFCNRMVGAFNEHAIMRDMNSESQSDAVRSSVKHLQIEEGPNTDYINCQQAIEYINSESLLEFRQSVKLDEFEHVARELEVLDW